MSHLTSRVRVLAVFCAMSMTACSGGDNPVAPPSGDAVRRTFVTRRGIDGLRQDIAWIRSLPRDVTIATSLETGASMSASEFASRLEAMVPGLSRAATVPAGSVTSPLLTPNAYFGSYGPVNGHLSLMPRNIPGWRAYDAYGYTSCPEPSMTIAEVQGHMDEFDFATGVQLEFTTLDKASAPTYASTRVSAMRNRYFYPNPIGVKGSSTHTCQIGVPNEWQTGSSNVFIVI